MKKALYNQSRASSLKVGKIGICIALFIFVLILAIFQDYIYSRVHSTGFYISESLTYNMFWAFFIPLGFVVYKLLKLFNPNNSIARIVYLLIIGALFSVLHIFIFTCFFIFISNVFFTPPHRFSAIFKSALSNQLYIAFILYTIGPFIYVNYIRKNKPKSKSPQLFSDKISLKIGSTIKSIQVDSIHLITTDRPYTIVHTSSEKFLQDKSLKDFEKELDPTHFYRVHRSAIVNKAFISEMISRKNGDYDVKLSNGLSIRFSRHFRENWKSLLH